MAEITSAEALRLAERLEGDAGDSCRCRECENYRLAARALRSLVTERDALATEVERLVGLYDFMAAQADAALAHLDSSFMPSDSALRARAALTAARNRDDTPTNSAVQEKP